MNNSFIKKILEYLEPISVVLTILGFFGINFKSLKLIVRLIVRRLKVYMYKIRRYFTYGNHMLKKILFEKFLYILYILETKINSLKKILFPMIKIVAGCFLCITFFASNIIICGEGENAINEGNDIFEENIYHRNMDYVTSGNVNNQLIEKNVSGNSKRVIEPIEDIGFKLELEYPDGHPQIRENKFERLYNSIFYTEEKYLDEVIKSEIDVLRNSYRVNTQLDDEAKAAAYHYSQYEDELFNSNNYHLSSELLDEIIDAREELFKIYPNATMSWLLANNYQIYAYNYLTQTTEANSILYFYMQSIYYAKMSLEFDIDAEDKEMRIKYIYMRYKDIASCNILDDEIRFRAFEISQAIDNVFLCSVVL